MTRWILLPVALGLVWWFFATLRRLIDDARDLARQKASALDQVAALLDAPRRSLGTSGLPELKGLHDGHAFAIKLVADSLTFRKLPALWLMVTLTETQDVAGEARLLARGSGQEPFTTFAQLPVSMALPRDFPEQCALRVESAAAVPPEAAMRFLAQAFHDPALKEAVVGRNGLRFVLLAEEADRVPYLIYREAGLGRRPVPAETVRRLMNDLVALSETLNG